MLNACYCVSKLVARGGGTSKNVLYGDKWCLDLQEW
jgi:hypothetical protein